MERGFIDLQKCDHSTDNDNDTRLQMLALLHNVITVQTRTMTQDYRCWLCFTDNTQVYNIIVIYQHLDFHCLLMKVEFVRGVVHVGVIGKVGYIVDL